jgi:perosamine synthetase
MTDKLIQIYVPLLNNYKKSAIDAIESGWISNHGKYTNLATEKLKTILNVKYVILMSNGTVATHCMFMALKHKYPNIKKIYVPNNCYVAVYNCALIEYDINDLHIMRIDNETWNMCEDENYIMSLEKDSAVMIVHNVGGIIDVDKIKLLRPDLILIEDNCEGLFGKYNNKYTGSSDNVLCTSISFYGNKTITTGEGGAFLTNDDDVYNFIGKVYTQGMSDIRFVHNIHAYNYRMTNIEAGFLYDQLNDIEHILELKKNVFNYYEILLSDLIESGDVQLQKIHDNCERANWMFTIKLVNNNKSINDLEKYFIDNKIETRPFFYPYCRHEHLKQIKYNYDDIEISEKLNNNVIMLPSYPTLTKQDQEYIVDKIKHLD